MVAYQSDHDHWQLGLLDSCDVCAAANLDSNIATACCICAKVALLVGRFASCVGSAVQSLAEHPVRTVRQLLAEELPLIAGKVGQPCFPCLIR